jgi:hypothetical protein
VGPGKILRLEGEPASFLGALALEDSRLASRDFVLGDAAHILRANETG